MKRVEGTKNRTLEMLKLPKQSRGSVLLKKLFFKFLQNSQGNTCACVSLFIQLQTGDWRHATLSKIDSNTVVFLQILRNFSDHLYFRTPVNDC